VGTSGKLGVLLFEGSTRNTIPQSKKPRDKKVFGVKYNSKRGGKTDKETNVGTLFQNELSKKGPAGGGGTVKEGDWKKASVGEKKRVRIPWFTILVQRKGEGYQR